MKKYNFDKDYDGSKFFFSAQIVFIFDDFFVELRTAVFEKCCNLEISLINDKILQHF